MYYVYVLELNDKSFYIGSTSDLKRRFKEHSTKCCDTTKHRLPCDIYWYCSFREKEKALEFEKYLKSGSGTAFRHRHIET